jgi:hypothetical protein
MTLQIIPLYTPALRYCVPSHHRRSSGNPTTFSHKGNMAANTKEIGVGENQASSTMKCIDDAWSYLNTQHHDGHDTSSVNIKALRRKIDWRIVPLMFGCYTMQFLDKVILNVSYSELERHRTDSISVLSRHGYSEGPTSYWQRLLEHRYVPLRRLAMLRSTQ